jgi:peptidoglycan pentaglycine glycine transferase (the first glycine)
MQITEFTKKNKQKYNQFVEDHPLGNIHQLWEFGEFQITTQGRSKMWAIGLMDREIQSSAMVIKQDLPFNKCWLYCIRGPLINYNSVNETTQIFDYIKKIAKKENAIYLRFDPALEKESVIPKAKKAHAHYQPESTLIISLQPSEEEILTQMKPKGRYNIKIAQKHGVKIRLSEDKKEDLQKFYKILKETTARDQFSGHPLSYYENMLEKLGPKKVKLWLAEYNNKIIAGVIATYFADTVTYYFGASASQNRNIMAPYLLHWEIMKHAKKEGYEYYDMFGIAPENSPHHPWAGVTEFKLKFGGKRMNYIPAMEIIYQPFWYLLMKAAKIFRRF